MQIKNVKDNIGAKLRNWMSSRKKNHGKDWNNIPVLFFAILNWKKTILWQYLCYFSLEKLEILHFLFHTTLYDKVCQLFAQ